MYCSKSLEKLAIFLNFKVNSASDTENVHRDFCAFFLPLSAIEKSGGFLPFLLACGTFAKEQGACACHLEGGLGRRLDKEAMVSP